MSTRTDLVYGERPVDLLPPLRAIAESAEVRADGMLHAVTEFEMAVGAPLLRALMRAEAELLLEDADRFGTPGFEGRTSEQRGADALARLASALTAA